MAHGAGILLLSAVAGYWVLERADTHKGSLRRAGRLVGWIIIVTSFIGIACRVWCAATCPTDFTGKGHLCPFSSKSAPAMPSTP